MFKFFKGLKRNKKTDKYKFQANQIYAKQIKTIQYVIFICYKKN